MSGAVRVLALVCAVALASAAGLGGTAQAVQDAAGGFPRTVEHALGSTEIPAEPRRIVALDQTFVDAAFAIETPIVGFTEIPGSGSELPEYLGEARATLGRDAESVGPLDNLNVERVAALRPDLILSARIRHEELYDTLSQIAPTVFSETTGPTWKDNIRLLAQAVGKEELAEQRISEYERRAMAIGDAIRAEQGGNPTISLIRFLPTETRLYQKASFSGIVLADTGLARPPSQDVDEFAVPISEERIPDAEADYIFVTVTEGGESAQVSERFRANPLWGQLDGEVHEVSDAVWGLSVGLQGAHALLDDLARIFGVDPARPAQ
ncbi:MAG: ABC transporter substrate-binding protein [Egibacteraceae bacterium]